MRKSIKREKTVDKNRKKAQDEKFAILEQIGGGKLTTHLCGCIIILLTKGV